MRFVTQYSGLKIVKCTDASCNENEICPAILNCLIKSLKGKRTLILNNVNPGEVSYKTDLNNILTKKACTFLNCFHQGRICVGLRNDEIEIKYNLVNYTWIISSCLMILFLLFIALLTGEPVKTIGVILLIFMPWTFFMLYSMFFLIPVITWHYKLNKLDNESYLKKQISEKVQS